MAEGDPGGRSPARRSGAYGPHGLEAFSAASAIVPSTISNTCILADI